MGWIKDYLLGCWHQGEQQAKDLKKKHKDKIRRKKEE